MLTKFFLTVLTTAGVALFSYSVGTVLQEKYEDISYKKVFKVKNKSPEYYYPPTFDVPNDEKVKAGLAKKIRRLTLNSERTVFLLGPIAYNATSVARKISALAAKSNDTIYVVIDSPGGQVFRGAMVLSAMDSSQANVYTICYNICASMAAVIHQAGKKRLALDRSVLMFHPATSRSRGDVNRIHSYGSFTKRFVNKMDVAIQKRMGINWDKYQLNVMQDWWSDSEDILKMGVDELVYFDLSSSNLVERVFQETTQDRINRGLHPDYMHEFNQAWGFEWKSY